MTETIPKPPANIAEAVRHSRGPTGDMADLAAQAQRLGRSVAVAEKWMEAASAPSESGELFYHAEFTRDKLEEELSRVCFEMEVLESQRVDSRLKEAHPDFEIPAEAKARAAVLSNTLLEAYCILREAPEEVVGERRERFKLMGALLAAQDALGED